MAKLLNKNQTRHGYHGTRVYNIWVNIVKRCEIKSSGNYKYYGGRGIKVCDEWRYSPKAFCDWALENGYKDNLTIDRIDVNGDYEPNNVCFITHKENCAPGKRRLRKDNKTGVTGVSMSKSGSYEVYKTINGKQTYIGCRKTLEEAIKLKINGI